MLLLACFIHVPQASRLHGAGETPAVRIIRVRQGFSKVGGAGVLARQESSLPAGGDARAARLRFLQVSTDEVYGSLGPEGLFRETTPYAPSSPYAASKAAADHLVQAWHHTFGVPTLITNCSNNYGPYQFPEKLIPLMILNALEGRPLPGVEALLDAEG